MKVGTKVQKKGEVYISKDYIYVMRDIGRTYALFKNCKRGEYCKLNFNEKKATLKYGSTLIQFIGKNAKKHFEYAKEMIGKWANWEAVCLRAPSRSSWPLTKP